MKHRSTSFFSFSRKKILGFLAIFVLSGIALQGNVGMIQETHAAGTTNGSTQTANTKVTDSSDQSLNTISMIDIVLKMVYVLLWPLLVLAGWSLDNTLVYGSFFHLDAPLWKFWNMMKNFANFTLGFLVLFAILKSIFTNSDAGGADKDGTPLGIIKKTLIAGVLIQASWFLTSALIDVSTIATYAVGGLPLSVIKNTDIGDQKILSVNASLNLNKFQNITQKGKSFEVTYGAGKYNLSSCAISNNGDTRISSKYVVGRAIATDTEPGFCVLFGNTVVPFDEKGLKKAFMDLDPTNTDAQYAMFVQNTVGSIDESVMSERNDKGYIIDVTSAKFAPAKTEGKDWLDNKTTATSLSDVVNKSKGFVGVLATMYSSLLNFSQISDTSITSLGAVSGEVIIKAAIAIALLVPLIALTVVLIMRIGFLWLVIALSPFLIISEVFKIKAIQEGLKKIGLGIGNVVSVIFAPVVTVFALSISLIFLSALIKSFTPVNPGTPSTISSALGTDIQQVPTDKVDTQKVVVLKLFGLEFQNFTRGGSLDRFSRLIVNLVAVGLLRAVLFAAIRANSLGKYVADKDGFNIKGFAENMMGTLPVIPYGEGKVGVATALKSIDPGNTNSLEGKRLNKRTSDQNDVVGDFMNKKFATDTTPTSEQYTKIASSLASGKGLDLDEHVNKERKEENQITETTFLNNNDYMNSLTKAITTTDTITDKQSSYTTLGNLWGAEFKTKVEEASEMSAETITTDLNRNEATRAYASILESNKTELTNKKSEKFTVAKDPKDKSGKNFIATLKK